MEMPQVQFLGRVLDVPVVMQRQAPQERIQERIVEETDVPVPHVMEEIIEVVRQSPQEQMLDKLLADLYSDTIEVSKHIPQERLPNHTVEQIVDAPVSQIRNKTGHVIQLIPQERISHHVMEQTVDIPSLQIQSQNAEVVKATVKHVPQERAQSNTVEQTVAVPIPQIPKETHQITIANKKGGPYPAETDHVNQEAEDSRDEDEVDKMKIEAMNGLKNHCVSMRNTFNDERHEEFEAEHGEQTEDSVHTGNWLDKNQYEFEAKQKGRQLSQSTQQRRVMIKKVVTPSPVPQLIMQEVLVSFAIPRQTPMIQRVQKTVEVPQIQFIDKVVDAPVGVQNDPEIELEIPAPVAEDTPSTWTGVNPNIADPMNPVLSITHGEGPTPPVADPPCRRRKGSDITQSPRVKTVTRTHDAVERREIFIGDSCVR